MNTQNFGSPDATLTANAAPHELSVVASVARLATWTHRPFDRTVTLAVRVVEDVSAESGRYSGMVRCAKVGGQHTFLIRKSELVML